MNRPVSRIAERITLAVGFRRAAVAFVSGAAGALALPPVGFFPAMIAPMTIGVWLIDGCGDGAGNAIAARGARLRSAAVAGWFVGFGYFVAGLHWLGAAFLVEPDRFAWALPLGVFGLPAALALFTGIGFAVAAALWRPGWRRLLAFGFGLGLAEMLRGMLFTGFPWNAFGMALGQWPVLAQVACAIGLYGLTILTIVMAASPATLADPGPRRAAMAPGATALALLAAIAGFGALRLAAARTEPTPNVRLRIMQPNLPQDAKFRPAAGADILRSYLELSDRSTSPATAGIASATHLIWPESPFPFALNREPQALATIASALAGKTVLLTGAIRLEDGPRGASKAYNSLMVIDSSGKILGAYDKVHLVPFGEYLPGGWLLRALGLRQFVALPGGFDAGALRRPLSAPGLPSFQPLICYEAIFPAEVTPDTGGGPAAERPAFLLNITNDGWFGVTSGPYQHLAQARLRAIEEGLPLIRAANTGISAVIDPYGRTVKSLPLAKAGVLDSELPKPIPPTFFALYANQAVWLILATFLALVLAGRRRR